MEPKAAPLKQKVRVFQNTEGGGGAQKPSVFMNWSYPREKLTFFS